MFKGIALIAILFSVTASFAREGLDADVVFNTPGFHGAEDLTIESKLVDLISEASPGSSIRMAQYNFDRPAVALALNEASNRGVDVRVVLDGNNADNKDEAGNGTEILFKGQDGAPALKCADDTCIKFCKAPIHLKFKGKSFGGSCNGFVINHNKFFLFSKLMTGDVNVVAQSSENLSNSQMHMYNDLVIIKNDEKFFDGMTAYWQSLKRDNTRLSHFKDAVGEGPVVARFFPRNIGHDPVVDMLKRVSCQLPGSIIRVSAADFTRKSVAARLRDLAKAGCDVKAISRFEPQMFSPGKGVGNRMGHDLMVLPYKGKTHAAQSKNSIHTKLMLIDASIDGSTEKTPMILTGSHNLDFFSLHANDETMLEIQDQTLFDQYLKFWNRINSDALASGLTLTFADGKP